MNTLDRFISYFSPTAGFVRARARAQAKVMEAYIWASYSRQSMRGWLTSTGDADADTLNDLPTIRERSRGLHRNTPIARGALSTCRTNVVGSGLRLQSSIDREFLGMSDEEADAWERQAEREFNLWAKSKDCDASRTENFYQLQGQVFLMTLISGDVFVVMPQKPRPNMPYDLRLQVIEADRVRIRKA